MMPEINNISLLTLTKLNKFERLITVKSLITLIVCFEFKQKMKNLPLARIRPTRSSINWNDFIKTVMYAFVCFETKVVHIEIVGDFSTHAFLNCFKGFIIIYLLFRRGLFTNIYSNNATSYVTANNTLSTLFKFL